MHLKLDLFYLPGLYKVNIVCRFAGSTLVPPSQYISFVLKITVTNKACVLVARV